MDAGTLDCGLASPYLSDLPDGGHGNLLAPRSGWCWDTMEHTPSTGFVERVLITLWIVSAVREGGVAPDRLPVF
jgi:hypothetical protein